MTLTIQTHKRWQVASNAAIDNESVIEADDTKIVFFQTTESLSPYLWTINVGDFEVSTFDAGVVP